MSPSRTVAVSIATLAAALVWGCGPQHVRTYERPGQDVVTLLPDPVDGTVGRAVVSNPAGTVELSAARQSTTISPNQPPAPVTVMSEGDARRLFGAALSALPPAPQHFILYFRFESEELMEQSRALVPQVVQAAKSRPFPDVAVVGHTDTTGTSAGNVELGLRRANAVRSILLESGIDAALIEVASHGETDLLVKTADEVLEPRNRRVDITVR